MQIDRLDPAPSARDLDDLVEVLTACVGSGASVGFLDPLDVDLARTWWIATLADPHRRVFVARDEGRVVGTVALVLAGMPNQPHRADVSKLLVHPTVRRRGLARALLATVETDAARLGRTLLVLDTETGSPAESIYAGYGWRRIGVIEDYALTPSGVLHATTIMAKTLPLR